MAKKTRSRDYRVEYARRIERGRAKGLSRSQARGHPRAAEGFAAAPEITRGAAYDRRLETGYKAMSRGKSLSAAAREIGVSQERLRRYVKGAGLVERKGSRWLMLPDMGIRRMQMYSRGRDIVVQVDRENASEIGRYGSAVGRYVESNDPGELAPFIGRGITDTGGKLHPFETDPNELYRLAFTGGRTFEEIYRIIR